MTNPLIRVLHVDDDKAEFVLLRELLSTAKNVNFQLQWVSDITAATQVINNTKFDICLIDYTLDIENGLDFVRMSIANGITIPFILMSGHTDVDLHAEAQEAGVYQCINKNVATTSILTKAIQDALAN